jgi:phosphate acyltransferase
MRIGVDVMGGDNAPDAILEGAVGSLERLAPDDELVLAGQRSVIEAGLKQLNVNDPRVTVLEAAEVIAMDESPAEAVRTKQNSSIALLAKAASKKAEGPLDVVISAGNTGAMVAAAQMHMRRLPGVRRSGIAVVVPTFAGPIVLIDVGANIEPKPDHLAQYGVMGEIYARKIVGIDKPRVALMNVGGEEQKGTAEMKQARDMLRSIEGLNFTGYIEGRAVFSGQADVIITDGVVGNVMIKLAEGLSEGIFKAIGREVMKNDPSMAERFGAIVKKIYAAHDYHEYGGAPLIGVNGVCIISHGSSVARTITNAIMRGKQYVECGVNEAIEQCLASMDPFEAVPA